MTLLLEVAVTLPDPLRETLEAAHAADIDAITQGLPHEARTEAVVRAAMDSLEEHGLLNGPLTGEAQLERDARLLAAHSGSPRWAGDGWTYLRVYEHDVISAHRNAVEKLTQGEEKLARRLAAAKARLLDNLQESAS